MHPLAELAKKSVESYIRDRKVFELSEADAEGLSEKAGVFVCLKKKDQLRGCIGTFMPAKQHIADEIIANAVSAATQDPRFPPVTEDELEDISYSVDVLSTPEKVSDLSELDPRRYGVIVTKGSRKGLLLPDLEGVDTVKEQLNIAKMKAGILPDEPVEILRFEVKRYK